MESLDMFLVRSVDALLNIFIPSAQLQRVRSSTLSTIECHQPNRLSTYDQTLFPYYSIGIEVGHLQRTLCNGSSIHHKILGCSERFGGAPL